MSTQTVYEYVVYLNDPKEKTRKLLVGPTTVLASSENAARTAAGRQETVLAVALEDVDNIEVVVRPFLSR